MATKEIILNKIQILITNQFSTPDEAFDFFDKEHDEKLKRSEVVKLLEKAEISGASKLIEGYDKNSHGLIDWEEFKV